MKVNNTYLVGLVVALLSSSFVFIWLMANQHYPVSDAAQFATVFADAARAYRADGIVKMLGAIYYDRMWKPVFFPHLGLPAMLITGDVRIAIKCTLTILAAATAFYLYLLVSLRQTIIFASALTLLVMSMPFAIVNGIRFMGEAPFILSFLGFLYHAERTKTHYTHRQLAFAMFWFLLALLSRPVEGVIMLSTPFVALLIHLLKNKFTKSFDLWVVASFMPPQLLMVTLYYMAYMMKYQVAYSILKSYWFLIFTIIPWVLALSIFIRDLWRRKNYSGSIISFSILLVDLWYRPFFGQLLDWIYKCTFGELAKKTGGRGEALTFFEYAVRTVGYFGGLEVLLFAIVFAMSLYFVVAEAKERLRSLPWSLLTAILIPFLLGLLTYNSDPRYYSASVFGAFVFLGFACTTGTQASKLIFSLLFVTFIGSNIFVYSKKLYGQETAPILNKLVGHIEYRPARSRDRGVEIHDFIMKRLGPLDHQLKKVAVMGYTFPKSSWHLVETAEAMDPWKLSLIAAERGENVEYVLQSTARYSIEDILMFIRCRYELVLIGPLQGIEDPIWDMGGRVGTQILKAWRNNKLIELGLAAPEEFDIKTDEGEVLSFFTVRLIRPDNNNCGL